jgi:hypothetical protein
MFSGNVDRKPFTLVLANGKQESFDSGYKMWVWYNRHLNANKKPGEKKKEIKEPENE